MNFKDNHIIEGCLKGDRIFQKQLYNQYKVFLFGVCMRYAQNKTEAEDILSEGFYKILKDLHQFSGNASLQSWMRKVMVNTALMHIRKYRRIKYSDFDEIQEKKQSQPDYSLFESNRAQAIIAMIHELPLPQQTIFNLRAMDGYSFKEISTQLEINESTVRSHYLRARKKLQFLLQKELY